MNILNLTFPLTKFRRGYDGQEVDQLLNLIAANLALPLAERTLRPEEVTTACFKSTQFRDGYDEKAVDRVLEQLAVELGRQSPSELRDAHGPTAPPPASPFAPTVVTASPTTAARPADDYRPDATF